MIKSDTVSQSSDSLLSLIVAATKQLPKHSMLIIRGKDSKVACVRASACVCMFVSSVDLDRRRHTQLSAFMIRQNSPESFPLYSPRVETHYVLD